jgi:hypothetical protein
LTHEPHRALTLNRPRLHCRTAPHRGETPSSRLQSRHELLLSSAGEYRATSGASCLYCRGPLTLTSTMRTSWRSMPALWTLSYPAASRPTCLDHRRVHGEHIYTSSLSCAWRACPKAKPLSSPVSLKPAFALFGIPCRSRTRRAACPQAAGFPQHRTSRVRWYVPAEPLPPDTCSTFCARDLEHRRTTSSPTRAMGNVHYLHPASAHTLPR